MVLALQRRVQAGFSAAVVLCLLASAPRSSVQAVPLPLPLNPAAKAQARSGRSASTLAVLAGPLSVVGGRRAGALLVSWPCRWVVARAGPVALACCSWRLVALLVLARRCSCLHYRNA